MAMIFFFKKMEFTRSLQDTIKDEERQQGGSLCFQVEVAISATHFIKA